MSKSSVSSLTKLLDEVLADAYGRDAERFLFELAIQFLNGRDLEAACAAIAAQAVINPSSQQLELVFEGAQQLLSVRKHTDLLATMAKKEDLQQILLRLQSGEGRAKISPKMLQRQPRIKAMSSPLIALPNLTGIQIAQTRLSPQLLGVLNEFLENPDQACGIVDISTQRQLVITEASARMILRDDFDRLMEEGLEAEIRRRVAAATNLRREDYCYSPDLELFTRLNRELEPNNPQSRRELRWRGRARDGSWVEYFHEYWAIQDDLGLVYHVGRNIAFEPIPEPVAV